MLVIVFCLDSNIITRKSSFCDWTLTVLSYCWMLVLYSSTVKTLEPFFWISWLVFPMIMCAVKSSLFKPVQWSTPIRLIRFNLLWELHSPSPVFLSKPVAHIIVFNCVVNESYKVTYCLIFPKITLAMDITIC